MPDFASGLNPQYRYLWLQVPGRQPVVLALGFEESTPSGLLETWYSSDNAFVQTLNGRLASVRGLALQWRSVQWQGQPEMGTVSIAPVLRTRDVLPSYTYGVVDQLVSQAVSFVQVPPAVLPPVGGAAFWTQYPWFREKITTQPSHMSVADSWYAVGVHRGLRSVVGGFQCMDQKFCFTFARWPLEPVSKL